MAFALNYMPNETTYYTRLSCLTMEISQSKTSQTVEIRDK